MAMAVRRALHIGEVVGLFIAPQAGAPMQAVPEVEAVAGRGLKGDRYFQQAGTFSRRCDSDQEVTLIELEVLEELERERGLRLPPAETRRNIVTRGVSLNELVGRTFRVGEVPLRGVKLCEPCKHLMRLAGVDERVIRALIHRAGLRAQILQDGRIRVGDPIDIDSK